MGLVPFHCRSRMDRLLVLILVLVLYGGICGGQIGEDSSSLGDLEKYLQPDHVGVHDDEPSRSARTLKNFRCDRPCVEGDKPRICYYRFYLEAYHTLGVACGTCPRNFTQCTDPQCVTADGFERGILTVNRRLPGPSIQVCQGDRVIVDVKNLMPGRSTTIHWHGIFQRGTQYSDGVPMVTQCPINEGAHFRYDFLVPEAGTMFWHSHDGMQKVDGIVGSIVVRQPRTKDPNSHLYDHDLRSHVVLVTDWFHLSGDQRFPGLRGREPGQNPDTFLINGKGRYVPTPFGPPFSSVLPTIPHFISRPFATKTPISVFRVIPGERFRFRMIGGTCLVCPVQISIEKHRLLLIATDATAVEPVLVDSIVFMSGERYDFVVEASQPVSSYWIHVKGLGPCEEERRAFQVAVLQYIGSNRKLPPSPHPGFAGFTSSQGVTLNPLDVQCSAGSNGVCIDQLISVLPVPAQLMALEPSLRLVVPFGFRFFNREELFQTNTYQRFFQPPIPILVAGMINNISNVMPSSPILSQREDIPLSAFCADGVSGKTGCNNTHCECFQLLTLPLGAVVELLIADESPMPGGLTHPFHLHGHEFRIMAVGLFSQEQNIHKLMDQLSSGKLQLPRSNLAYRAPTAKDTVAVPAAGYAVVRFVADNPGYWMMHCHFLWHQNTGMNLIVQVGETTDLPPVPAGFPRCGDFLPSVHTNF